MNHKQLNLLYFARSLTQLTAREYAANEHCNLKELFDHRNVKLQMKYASQLISILYEGPSIFKV